MIEDILKELEYNEKFYHAIAYRYLSDHQESQDAVQNAFIRAYRHIPADLPRKKLRKWLAVICSNEAKTLLTRKKHISLSDDFPHPVIEPISPYGNPHDMEFYYEDITYAAVKLAPAEYQQALYYFYKNEVSLLQAAQRYGVPESNLRYWRKKVARKAKEFL